VTAGERGRRALDAELASVRARLEGDRGDVAEPSELLDAVCAAFRLSPFERSILALCAGAEIDGAFSDACARAGGSPFPTFGLALARLQDAHWSAITPAGPLRRWRLVVPEPGAALTRARLRIDERVLHFLAGVSYLDPAVDGLVEPVDDEGLLAPAHSAVAEVVARAIGGGTGHWPRVELLGPERVAKRAIAARASAIAGRRLYRVDLVALPGSAEECAELVTLWEREAALGGLALLVEDDETLAGERDRLALRTVARRAQGVVMVSSTDPLGEVEHSLRIEVAGTSARERAGLWRQALGDGGAGLNGHIQAVAEQFDLDAAALRDAGDEAMAGGDGAVEDRLWAACRARARPRLDDLAVRVESSATWDDLVVPPDAARTLRELTAQVRRRERVYVDWGFASRSARGLGISALFAGQSGTGKTMAAEVVANSLGVDLYRIDLSSVVSKYIGETEKNLRRVFDAAERGAVVLLFDEADALFGKRTEVKDSHDRFANIEVSYLLQRMEAYRGLAILTTNRRDAIDEAFLRRLRFVVEFSFPDVAGRAAIWERIFPESTPLDGVDPHRLAQLSVAGGNIRNIALGAAFLAADEQVPVGMGHLRRAARTEYAKLQRPQSSLEIELTP
jgi:hypothetical protein